MIHYILQTIACQLLFLLVYDLFLKKETFFNWNRLYLIATPVLSFLLPLIKIDAIQQSIPPEYTIQLPAVLIGNVASEELVATSNPSVLNLGWETFWILGVLISLTFFGYKLYKLFKLKRSGSTATFGKMHLVLLPKSDAAFSFFNTVFLGEKLSETQQKNILLHEKVHMEQRHSIDLLFFELLRVLCWFNPLIYVFQNRMELLQEFIADAGVASQKDKREYYQDLLSQVFHTEKISFINTFFNHSLIKKRIVMLQKSRSKKIFQLKYLLLVPVVCGMLIYTSCAQETKSEDTAVVADFQKGDTSQSEIISNIEALKESIAAKGNLTPEEEIALKTLVVLTSDKGMGDIRFDAVKDSIELPFGVIDKVPIYPGCEGLANEATKKCFIEKISAFVGDNFNVKKLDGSGLSGRQKIVTTFIINNKGEVVVKEIKANHPALKAEALRTLQQLPNMLPGEHEGKKVAVQYNLPIIFEVAE
ncbi:beta-lactamase regulating signal transducer with metallopeptidase domain [Ulvibacter sp. MAR_2010_11]|uniref:M56 family metallopeptidase n=1 Tax=Ulvibacter sp. MAR_2010_11 TaxID=1250229 RepID=UPI000C2BF512|nr:M56 family metallopeptidase [Ulvibacter sp. MAR_2010_11]PKA82593.1 beta-lactamase regulating signal transducer with metallopeptidase domain [Ulvibacter sp. MAR_2010_11]